MDPVANAIHGLIQHIQASEKRMDMMCETIRKLGGQVPDAEKMPELNECELNADSPESKVD
jgi:serine O-acetyltransferase